MSVLTLQGSGGDDVRLPKSLDELTSTKVDAQAKKVKKIKIATCSLGGGHNSAANATKHAVEMQYKKAGIPCEVTIVDMYDAIRPHCDFVYRLASKFGLKYTFEEAHAFAQKTGILMILNLVSGPLADCDDNFFDAKRKLEANFVDAIREQFLKDDPDVIVSTTPIPLGAMLRTAQGGINGKQIPIVKVATDVEAVVDEVNTNNPLYFTCTMNDHELAVGRIKKVLPESQIITTGYPIRPQFLEKPTEATLKSWEEKWGVTSGKAALFSNGANGIASDLPERMLRSKDQLDEDLHLFVVCGTNDTYYQQIENLNKLPADKKNPRVFLHPLKKQNAENMHELMCLSKVVVGKQGGATAAEIFYSGTRLLVDHSLGVIWWEKHNFKALELCGMAEAYTSNAEFTKKFKEMLFNPKPVNEELLAKFTTPKPLENIVRVIDHAIEKAEEANKKGEWYPLPERFYYEKNQVVACVEQKFKNLHTAPLGYNSNPLEQAGAFLAKPFVRILNTWNQPKVGLLFKVALAALAVIFAPIMFLGVALQYLGKTIHHEKKIVTDAALKRTAPSVIDNIYDALRLIDKEFHSAQLPYLAAGSTLRGLMDRGGLLPWEQQGIIKIRDRDVTRILATFEEAFEENGFNIEGPKNGKIIVKPKEGSDENGLIELRICKQREDGQWEYADSNMKDNNPDDVVSDQEFHTENRVDFGVVGHPLRFSLKAPLHADKLLKKLEGERWLEEIIIRDKPITSTYKIEDKEEAVGSRWARTPQAQSEEKVA